MAWMTSCTGTASNTRTILSVMPASPSRSLGTGNTGTMSFASSDAHQAAATFRPVHRVNGRAMTRKPDRSSTRSRSACPFRFRLAWWSRPAPPQYFKNLCENCETNRAKKSGARDTLSTTALYPINT